MKNVRKMLYGWENPQVQNAKRELCWDIYSNVWSQPPSQLNGKEKQEY